MDLYQKLDLVLDTIEHVRELYDAGGHPAHVNMQSWGEAPHEYQGGGAWPLSSFQGNGQGDRLAEEWEAPSCSTVACLAGWCFLNPAVRADMARQSERWDSPDFVQHWIAGAYELDAIRGGFGANAVFETLFSTAITGEYADDEATRRGNLLDELAERVTVVEEAARAEDDNKARERSAMTRVASA